MMMITKLLIANRGTIARRIARTCRRMGIATIAVYAADDAGSLHIAACDEACLLECDDAETGCVAYLDGDAIIRVALEHNAQAIHPGYGFLSENAVFAQKCADAGLIFIGPTPESMAKFGVKHGARALAKSLGVPILEGTPLLATLDEAIEAARSLRYPVLLKSTAGGGGIGMKACENEEELRGAFDSVRRLAMSSFKDGGVFLERYVPRARHVEVQIFGDRRGKAVAIGDRDCSSQRRQQKVMEEAPAPNIEETTRKALHTAAVAMVEAVKYGNAGTVEFLLIENEGGKTQEFFFLEVNTRLQVEHGVTEEVFGLDLVEWMILEASGTLGEIEMRRAQLPAKPIGHSLQVRLYAEDPFKSFAPCAGLLTHVKFPESVFTPGTTPRTRVETWVETGVSVSPSYDPMIAKVIATANTREEAIAEMASVLETRVEIYGVETNFEFLLHLVRSKEFGAGPVHTRFLTTEFRFHPLTLDVLDPGPLSSIQDYPGRLGYWAAGVPPSGPMDDLAFRVANALVGNELGAPGLEMTLTGATLKFNSRALACVTGADVQMELANGSSSSSSSSPTPVTPWKPFWVEPGSVLRPRSAREGTGGCRTYLAVSGGGFKVPEYLGSRSTFAMGGFGGHAGRILRYGDVLHLRGEASAPSKLIVGLEPPRYPSEWRIGVMYGPHGAPDFFESCEFLFSEEFKVHYNSNRLGIRLVGPKPRWARADGGEAGLHPSNIHDTVYAIGSVNFTGDMGVILCRDGPSLGGFVCPVTVVAAEKWKLGQMSAGDSVRFVRTSFARALEAEIDLDSRLALLRSGVSVALSSPAELLLTDGRAPPPFSAWDEPVARTLEATGEAPVVVYRMAGDKHVLVEYGPMALDLALRMRVRALSDYLHGHPLTGLEEIAPGVRSLQIRFDGRKVALPALLDHLVLAEKHLPPAREMKVASRIVRLPLAFDEATTKAAVAKYRQSVREDAPWLPSNVEFIRRINGLDSVEDVRRIMYEARYLVLGLGDVYLGAPCALPRDPRHRLRTTKYNPARTWTAEGGVGIGGVYLCVYGMESPGGYQLVGRTNQIWNTYRHGGTREFALPWLLREFDQISWFPVTEVELEEFRGKFLRGEAHLPPIEEVTFDMGEYISFLETNKESIAQTELKRTVAFEEERRRWAEEASAETANEEEEGEREVAAAREEAPLQDTPELVVVRAPVSGKVWSISASLGDVVLEDSRLAVVEAMKMEVRVEPPASAMGGTVEKIIRVKGDAVVAGEVLLVVRRRRGAVAEEEDVQMSVAGLRDAYRTRTLLPSDVVKEVYKRLDLDPDSHLPHLRSRHRHAFIYIPPFEEVLAIAEAQDDLVRRGLLDQHPLLGIPFCVKDNIDVADVPTTAGCPAFGALNGPAKKDAEVVRLLRAAGAIFIGKTNLDQFAAGLVGCRSPFGVPSCVFDERFISGGSSSGSAVAVAANLAAFSLGTDTAGSGRVPAAFNNLVGMKPTRGILSNRGVLPACASLDCVAIFARTASDALEVFKCASSFDSLDPFSRVGPPSSSSSFGPTFRFGVPDDELDFFGDVRAHSLYRESIDRLMSLGGIPCFFDAKPFLECAEMLYGGPWLAERLEVVESFLASHEEAEVHPVTRAVLAPAKSMTAVETFRAMHKLEVFKMRARAAFKEFDVLVLPTTGTTYTIEQVLADPVKLNSNLGKYTNFANFLDLCGVAVPAGFRKGGSPNLPFGITLFGEAFKDHAVLELADRFHRALVGSGAALWPQFPSASPPGRARLVVVGAHLAGQPLNHQLLERGGRLERLTRTAPRYRLYALKTTPPKPGMVRVSEGGRAIEVEVWSLETREFGDFVARCVSAPLCVGTIELEDGTSAQGFLCESAAAGEEPGAPRDISDLGGWRAFLEGMKRV